MKALTVWQPWASLIVEGAKPYEFRGWRAHQSMIGQRIVIHAAARTIRAREIGDLLDDMKAGGEAWASRCLHQAQAETVLESALRMTLTGRPSLPLLPSADDLPYSAGLGTAVIGEPRNGFDIAEEFGLPRVNDSDRDEHANWGWPMLDIEKWDEPIPLKGAQGFWNWPEPESVGL